MVHAFQCRHLVRGARDKEAFDAPRLRKGGQLGAVTPGKQDIAHQQIERLILQLRLPGREIRAALDLTAHHVKHLSQELTDENVVFNQEHAPHVQSNAPHP
jgi:hypothetical protein